MAHWDVSTELRGYHGKWTKGGAALQRMAKEAGGESRGASLEDMHKRVQEIASGPEGHGKGVNGFMVRNTAKGIRVTMPGKTQHYKDPREAAVAVYRKQHHEEGHSPIPLPGTEPPHKPPVSAEPPRTPRAPEHQVGDHVYVHTGKYRGETGVVTGAPSIQRPDIITVKRNDGTTIIVHKDNARKIEPPRTPETPPPVFPGGITPPRQTERAARELARPARPRISQPRSIQIGVRGYGPDRNQRMRERINHISTIQATSTPVMVSRTDWKVTHTPHGRSKTSTTLASSTGSGNSIHIKPHVLIADNAQAVLERNRGGWWVPTDDHHDLATNVGIHEYGHGTHGALLTNGFMEVNKVSSTTKNKDEQRMWIALARALGAAEPGFTGPRGDIMDVGQWFRDPHVQALIKKGVSKYGTSTINEMIAELWTEHKLSSIPRAAAKVFGQWAEDKLKGVRA